MNSRSSRIIKKFLIAAIIIIVILTAAFIFTYTFNRFNVYKVYLESDDFVQTYGIYVETNIKDTLNLGSIDLRNVEIKNTDVVSIDLFYKENSQEYIIQTFSRTYNIFFENYQSYIKIDNLSKYFDEMYLRLTIINTKNETQTYETKLNFVRDFSNNKIFNKDLQKEDYSKFSNLPLINKTPDEIVDILLANNFKKINDYLIVKETKNYSINYYVSLNRIDYETEKSNLRYNYTYELGNNHLDIKIYDENNTEVENYIYDVGSDTVIECVTGSCNNYRSVLDLMEEKVFYLFR